VAQIINYLLLTIISFLFSGVLFVPFIGLLYKLKFQNPANLSRDILGRKTLFNKLQGHKVGTPIGGGILIIAVSALLTPLYFLLVSVPISTTSLILLLTLILFGALGLLDDLKKLFKPKDSAFSLRMRHKLAIQLGLALIISILLYNFLGKASFGVWYVLYSTLVITFFANVFNITDGLDGLAGGLFIISILALGFCAVGNVSVLTAIAVLFGAVLAFLYFNVSPARLFMGDTGALAFGAVLAVIALILDISIPLFIIGGVFVVDGMSSLLQWASFVFRGGKRLFKIAPLHHHFEALGWSEDKVVIRFWLAGIVCAIFGILFAQLGKSF